MSALGGATLFKSEVHTDFPSVAAEGGCVAVRRVSSLRGLAREIWQKASEDSWISAWPTVNSVPEPVGRAMGGFGLGLRTGQTDRLRSYCRQQVRPALGSSGHDLEGVFNYGLVAGTFLTRTTRLDRR